MHPFQIVFTNQKLNFLQRNSICTLEVVSQSPRCCYDNVRSSTQDQALLHHVYRNKKRSKRRTESYRAKFHKSNGLDEHVSLQGITRRFQPQVQLCIGLVWEPLEFRTRYLRGKTVLDVC